MVKHILSLIFVFSFIFSSAQENTILEILNRELEKEVKNQFDSPNFDGDTVRIVKPFTINENQILSYEIKKTSPYFEGFQFVKQEVPLKLIKMIIKDINVILLTDDDVVATTAYNSKVGSLQKKTSFSNLFFLGLSAEKQNEYLGIEIQEAFKKAGILIEKKDWYD